MLFTCLAHRSVVAIDLSWSGSRRLGKPRNFTASLSGPDSVVALLQKITNFASSMRNSIPDGAPLNMLALKQVISPGSSPRPSSLIDWQPGSAVPILVEPVLARNDLFRPDKKCWLAGLAGDLGRSLAYFMASQRARHFALSSRTPEVDQAWVQCHREPGTCMRYFSW